MQNVFNLLREKLEAQKEKYKKDRKNTYCRKTEMDDCDSCIADKKLQNRIDAIEDVKEIVNVVEEIHNLRVCEWHPSGISDEWKPSCDSNSMYNVSGVAWFKYCPYCGRKIEIKENRKTKVTELDVIVIGTEEKPYFQIKYKEVGNEYYNIGYGSYDISNVFNWREEYFEVIKE